MLRVKNYEPGLTETRLFWGYILLVAVAEKVAFFTFGKMK